MFGAIPAGHTACRGHLQNVNPILMQWVCTPDLGSDVKTVSTYISWQLPHRLRPPSPLISTTRKPNHWRRELVHLGLYQKPHHPHPLLKCALPLPNRIKSASVLTPAGLAPMNYFDSIPPDTSIANLPQARVVADYGVSPPY